MKKLKLALVGVGIAGFATIGSLFLSSTEVKASGEVKCEWNGEHCKNPTKTNYCGCEQGGSGNP